jgi:hypothetical protein
MIAKGNQLIDQTLAALNDLVSKPQPDLRPQFEVFSTSVSDLASTDRDVTRQAEAMKAQGATYFAKWDHEAAQMQNENIRHRSEARKHEVAANFARISQQYDDAKAAFEPFMSDLRDVQKFLGTDLTSGGLAASTTIATRATGDAAPLKAALNSLANELKGLSLSLSSVSGATQ